MLDAYYADDDYGSDDCGDKYYDLVFLYSQPDPCRSFVREDNCSYGSSSNYSHNIGTEMKKSKKEKYTERFDDVI